MIGRVSRKARVGLALAFGAWLGAAFFVCGCGDETRVLLESTQTMITGEGGVAKSADALFQLEFAAGTVASPITVVVQTLRDTALQNLGSHVYAIAPHGVPFATPVRISLEVEKATGITLATVERDQTERLAGASLNQLAERTLVVAEASMLASSYAAVFTDDEVPYDPCADKACGDPCTVCAPGDADCVETAAAEACNILGSCTSDSSMCSGYYNPCEAKSCGDTCSICAPGDDGCVETGQVKLCNRLGLCTPSTPLCS